MVTLTIGWVAAGFLYLRTLSPRQDILNFEQLQQQGVPMTRAVRIAEPAGHICVFGDKDKARWTLTSGPPGYLFNPSGRLVAFAIDTGDSPKFQGEYKVAEGNEIALKDLPELFRKLAP